MKVLLKPVPPYDFILSATIFSGGDNQVRNFEDGAFQQVIRTDNKLVLVKVKSTGTVDRPELEVELKSGTGITRADESQASHIITSMLNLKLDLKPFYQVAQSDEVLLAITRKLCGLKSPVTPSVYEALIDSIIEQQISLVVARSLQTRLTKSFGDALSLDSGIYYIFPTPERLAAAPIESLRRCGLSLRKAEYVREISGLVSGGRLDLERFKTYNDISRIIKEMDEIRGIGAWTAELTAIRGMGKLEAIPADDLGLRKVISHYYFKEAKISSLEARGIASKWGLWKGLASFYLIIARMIGIEVK